MVEEVRTKVKKKKWVALKTSGAFGDKVIGETPVLETKLALGKVIEVNAMTLLGDPRKQHLNLKFVASTIEGTSAVKCDLSGCIMLPSHMKRLIRRNKDKIDESYLLQTSDQKIIKVKPLLVTASNTKRSIRSELRRKAFELLAVEAKNTPFEQLVIDIITQKLQKKLKDVLSKIYPLRICEIRIIEIETEKKRIRAFKPVDISESAQKARRKGKRKTSEEDSSEEENQDTAEEETSEGSQDENSESSENTEDSEPETSESEEKAN